MSLPVVDDSTYDEIITNAVGQVGVLYWAPWCSNSQEAIPTVESYIGEPGIPPIYSMNTDENNATIQDKLIGIIPTLVIQTGPQLDQFVSGSTAIEQLLHGMASNATTDFSEVKI